MEYLTTDESIRGFAEASVLGEVSVEAGAAVAAKADLVIGGKFKLAFNSFGVNYRKDGYYAKRRRYRSWWPRARDRTWYGSRQGPG